MTLTQGSLALPRPADDAEDTPSRLRRVIEDQYDFVWRSLRRLGVPDNDSQDVAQEVFMTLARRVNDVELGKERAFLYRTAMNHAAHVHRTRARRREDPTAELDDAPCGTPSADELLDAARSRALFYAWLDELGLEQRAVFVLYELEQLTMAEIAELLELPPGTVASRLRRARAAFQSKFIARPAPAGTGDTP